MRARPRRLTYAPLDYATHPIDLVTSQEQGWGPFKGPYSPLDYADVAGNVGLGGLSDGYNITAFNSADHGPGYHDITLFHDPSLDRVNATLTKLANDGQKQSGQTYTNTISNGFTPSTSGAASAGVALRTKLQAALLGGK